MSRRYDGCVKVSVPQIYVTTKSFYFLLNYGWLTILCKLLLYRKVTQFYMCVCVCLYILFHTLFPYGLSQDIEYSSLCYTVGPCCLSILYIQFASANPKLPCPPSSTPFYLGNQQPVLCLRFCFVTDFRFHI